MGIEMKRTTKRGKPSWGFELGAILGHNLRDTETQREKNVAFGLRFRQRFGEGFPVMEGIYIGLGEFRPLDQSSDWNL